MKKLLFLLALCAPFIHAQTWVKVATESYPGVSVSLPAGTTYRYGIGSGVTAQGVDCSVGGCWATPPKLTAAATFSSIWWPDLQLPFGDPAVGLYKELDVLQTASVQTVTVNGVAVKVAANVMTYKLTGTCTATLDPSTNVLTVQPCTFTAVKQ